MNEGKAILILNLGMKKGERSALSSRNFIPREQGLGDHCTVWWVGPRASLDVEKKRKNFGLYSNMKFAYAC
jgi:hypothetical protein